MPEYELEWRLYGTLPGTPSLCSVTVYRILPELLSIGIVPDIVTQDPEGPPYSTPLEKFNTYIDRWSIARLQTISACIYITADVATVVVHVTGNTSSPRYIRAWNWDLVPNLVTLLIMNGAGFLLNGSWRAFGGPPEERHTYERAIHKLWLSSLLWVICNSLVKVACDILF